jgi:putative flippase GtrA
LPYLLSAAVAFLLGTVVNYLLSVLWVFRSSGRIPTEFVLFTLVGLGGLGLTELILWLLVEIVGLHYLQAKAVALGVVLVWSFTLRRLLFARLASARDGAPGR